MGVRRGEDPPPSHVYSELNGELIDWLFEEENSTTHHKRFIHHHLWEILIRLLGVSSVILTGSVLTVGLLIISLGLVNSPTTILSTIGLFLFTFGMTILATTAFVGISTGWQFSKWIRNKIAEYWGKQIPPHDALNVNGLSKESLLIANDYIFGFKSERLIEEPSSINPFPSCAIGINHLIYGYLVQLFFYFLILTLSEGGQLGSIRDATAGSEVSVWAAFISVFLRTIFGAITVGIASFSSSVEDILTLVSLFIIPAIFLAPAARNFVRASDSYHRLLLVKRKRPVLSALLFFSMYLVIAALLGGLLFSA